jgi:hypothetical protein
MKPIINHSCFCQSLEKGAKGAAYGTIGIGVIVLIAVITMISITAVHLLSGSEEEKYLIGLSYSSEKYFNSF